MSSRYDKNVSISREEEGTYHRREIESSPSKPSYTQQSYQVVKVPPKGLESSDDDNFEEWTTSKRKVNHKTRQVETRVSRQLLVEDGKVIADSGPQVTTRIKEDNKVEECEKEKAPKNKGRFEAIENAPECGQASGRVLGEKKEIQRVSREVREEHMQYHDERFKELTGHDVHRRAIQAPHELITITDKNSRAPPRGKMVHYSNKGKKYRDTDEILEIAKLAIDGSITKEVKRTKHHEECSEDEKPDETGEAEALRNAPTVTRSSRRHVDYVNDFDDTSTPSCSSEDEGAQDSSKAVRRYEPQSDRSGRQRQLGRQHSTHSAGGRHREHSRESKRHRSRDEEAFPRYEIDPLLNSLRDEDFRPRESDHERGHSARYIEHPLQKKDQFDSSDTDKNHQARYHQRQRSPSPVQRSAPVEIPEEYRTNRQRLLSGKGKSISAGRQRERSFSPTGKSHLSQMSHKSAKSHRSHRGDTTAVQAHLTDEEEEEAEERKSIISSSSGANAHEKTTKHLQRHSTANSQRNYYFGETRRRSPSVRSSSSASLSDPKERARKQGVRSRDSGFKSPHSMRTATPGSPANINHQQQQIYSVSSKATRRSGDKGTASPTPTTGSGGQRSYKTTTTTVSAGLADRPLSRNERLTRSMSSAARTGAKEKRSQQGGAKEIALRGQRFDYSAHHETDDGYSRRSFDNVSLSSLGPNATTIKVPYRKPTERTPSSRQANRRIEQNTDTDSLRGSGSDMKLHEDIENLRKRLDTISRKTSKDRGDRERPVTSKQDHFDYKTVVATVKPAPVTPRRQVVDTYNVRVIELNSPFRSPQPQGSLDEPINSAARLNSLSTELGATNNQADDQCCDNNNEASFNLNDYIKYKAVPVLVDSRAEDDDKASLGSSCSLRSSRTYDIRASGTQNDRLEEDYLDDQAHFPVEMAEDRRLSDEKRPKAWIFDPRDGSTTTIVAPQRPRRPESPKVESKTEELAESRGGRSYYLELVEPTKKEPTDWRQRPSSVDPILSSRWTSHSTVNVSKDESLPTQVRSDSLVKSPLASVELRRSRQLTPAPNSSSHRTSQPIVNSLSNGLNNARRRQLPFSGQPLSNRSRSSSCLIGPTRASKYSIYGGLRQPDKDNKPVPRLSYSRAIGPKSQRQIDAQSRTPSRYLKMK